MPHFLRSTLLAGLIIGGLLTSPVLPAASISSQLPDIGQAGSSTLSPREEQELGREFMRTVQQRLKLVDDPVSQTYVQNLADRLVSSVGSHHQNITIFLVDDPSINAFAGPGGYIGVHTGLLLAAGSEGELASVLAHEIAHVTQRHLVRAFEASNRMSLPTMGALIAAIVLGASNPQVSEAVLASTVASNSEQQLTFSRAHEQEADRIGLQLLANAHYDPRTMVTFFEKLQKEQRLTESGAPEFLRTHPLTLARIADTRNRAETYHHAPPRDNTAFQLIQVRAAVLSKSRDQGTPGEQTLAPGRLGLPAQQYLRALQASTKGDSAMAEKIIAGLLKGDMHRVLYHYSAAQIEIAANNYTKAKTILSKALEQFPHNRPLVELYADTLLHMRQPQPVFDLLQPLLRKHPEYLRLYTPYANAAQALGDRAEAYRALAELSYAQGNLYQAVDYLDQALRVPQLEAYERLSLEARRDMLKTEVKQIEQPVSQPSE